MKLDSYKKYKLKKWFQKKKIWVIGSGIFLLIGTILIFVGLKMTGFSFIAWLQSPYFVTLCVVLAVGFLTMGYVILSLIRHQLGGHDDE